MTIDGAISELNNLLKAENIPFYYKPSIKKVIETIEQDAIEQRIGHWIDVDGIFFKCSECDAYRKMMPAYKEYYCPNCGAKMQ